LTFLSVVPASDDDGILASNPINFINPICLSLANPFVIKSAAMLSNGQYLVLINRPHPDAVPDKMELDIEALRLCMMHRVLGECQ
jgi:hypothetical protein